MRAVRELGISLLEDAAADVTSFFPSLSSSVTVVIYGAALLWMTAGGLSFLVSS